ncbi:MAG: DinB family protein [Candidatus Limnocylindria bacterium]
MIADEIVHELGELHKRLRAALEGLSADQLDRVPADGANSIAVLVTHTLGSESAWLHRAGGQEIPRERSKEFEVRNAAAGQLLAAIDRADQDVAGLVRAAVDAGLETVRQNPGGRQITAIYCLLHAAAHTAEHVGHAEVTRQLIARR